MAKAEIPSQIALRNLFEYDAERGALVWKERGQVSKTWNSRFAGKSAGSMDAQGYINIGINGTLHKAHRLAWVLVNGAIPEGMQVDHKNRDRADNRIENLRLATPGQNRQNAKLRADNRTRLKGVDFNRKAGNWRARISCEGRTQHLGFFPTPEEAHAAYKRAASKLHGDFAAH